jgi:hypothetical protein
VTHGHNVLLDTSAVIDLAEINGEDVAAKVGCGIADLRPGISSVTLAELAAGPHATDDPAVRAVRQALLCQRSIPCRSIVRYRLACQGCPARHVDHHRLACVQVDPADRHGAHAHSVVDRDRLHRGRPTWGVYCRAGGWSACPPRAPTDGQTRVPAVISGQKREQPRLPRKQA